MHFKFALRLPQPRVHHRGHQASEKTSMLWLRFRSGSAGNNTGRTVSDGNHGYSPKSFRGVSTFPCLSNLTIAMQHSDSRFWNQPPERMGARYFRHESINHLFRSFASRDTINAAHKPR
jgi:hypothetical protein